SPTIPSGAGSGGGGTPPPLTASITSPSNGQTVSGTIQVTFASGNASGAANYTLKVDNANVLYSGVSSTNPTSTPWSTTAYSNGTHTLNLTVTDGAGRTATAAVSVSVNNTGGDTTPPSVTITSPPNGAWTGNSIDVHASSTDNV